ncbi:MAG TPA: LTA synthase family protein [Oligoflexus sp.]|uniref:LTA synthase family protein n=1 Tax=Oligoflexus sp. TaxID=1971216 RepID=UPI002D3B15CC|nr:LTA synthase family protein [Oligoflexus sp.]HYX32972.1 LTA synthase family protein [Oligoflexus sp.]
MKKPTYFHLFFADLLLFTALFVLHRAFTFNMLNAEVLSGIRQGSGFFVGVLSDLWIAGLLSLLTAGCHRLLWQVLPGGFVQKLRWLLFIIVAVLLASHQSYVEFFGFTMMAFHLRYLHDSAFIMANGQSLFSWPLVVYGGLLLALLLGQRQLGERRPRHASGMFLGAVLLLVLLHNRNIHWRVQWFIPENLQMNVLEKLYTQLRQAKAIEPVQPEERQRLLSLLNLPSSIPDFPSLMESIQNDPIGTVHPVGERIKGAWQDATQAKRKPILAVLLLESLRPAETGYFAPGTRSLTPHLDQLAQSSIVFTNAYSTGSVTRGGQEAVFCGHISSRDTSLMRYDAVAPIRCLSDVLQKPLADGTRLETFWYHGGNGLFDNQLSFWRKHGIQQLFTQDQFGPNAPLTGWGVGDVSFLRYSADEIQKLRQESQADAMVGMLLTVTNHIPWQLPGDIVPWALPLDVTHESYRTTAYADHAVGLFVQEMQTRGLWDDMILILVSDHGNQLPPYQDIYQDKATTTARLQSHINLIISGGLTQKALGTLQLSHLKRDELVSQVDVSQFLADTMGVDAFRGMGENLFRSARRLPVLSRLEQHLFDPASQTLLSPQAWQAPPASGDGERNILFYRAYIDYISTK